MREYAFDFHIHSCLSPCGDDDMTPNNLVNMAAISGCEIIAITDHNTCGNASAVMKAGESVGLVVVPGMELCTSEEAHIVCLFETLEGAEAFEKHVFANMPLIPNKPDIFGEQRIMNENDEQIGTQENLLIVSSFISVNEVRELVESFGGAAYPAHVNRDSYSVIASLGSIPPEAGFKTAELSTDCDREEFVKLHPELSDMLLLTDSDSHYLEVLATAEPQKIKLPELSAKAVVEAVRKGKSYL